MNTLETLLYNQVAFDAQIFKSILKDEDISVDLITVALSDALDVMGIAKGNGDAYNDECEDGCHM